MLKNLHDIKVLVSTEPTYFNYLLKVRLYLLDKNLFMILKIFVSIVRILLRSATLYLIIVSVAGIFSEKKIHMVS